MLFNNFTVWLLNIAIRSLSLYGQITQFGKKCCFVISRTPYQKIQGPYFTKYEKLNSTKF